MGMHAPNVEGDIFEEVKKAVLKFDPVAFCGHYLKVDGSKSLELNGTGWKFLADIYRYVAVNSLRRDGKPVVCVKGRQVGATTMAVALELFFTTSGLFGNSKNNPPMRILHCFPALNNVNKFAKDKLSTMMRTSTDDYVKKQGLGWDDKLEKKKTDVPEDTLTEKLFKDENKLWVDSNGNNASRLQGMTLDAIFHDEVQRMLEGDIGNGIRTLTASNYGPTGKGVQLYFGTPLSKGAYFWKIWNASDQRYFYMRCTDEGCSHYFTLYTPGSDDWEKIWLYGTTIQCPKCGNIMDKKDATELGKWEATKSIMDNGEEPLYVGFHFNQLIIPYMTKEAIQAENPKYNPTKSERIWQTEILGEFYSGSALPMTEEELYKYCKNPDRKVSSGIVKGSDVSTFMGVDWGGKNDEQPTGGQSYSTVLVASVGKNGIFQIENAFKMKKNELEYKKSVIHEMYRRFDVKITVADIGYGNDIVPDLQKEYQTRFWGCLNSGTLIKPIKVVHDNLSIVCNKDLMLDDIFNAMRKSKIMFPLKDSASFEQMNWLIEHCCSMETETKTISGNIVNKYVKGATPNDGLMALMYAYIAYKFYVTRGFKVKEHQLNDKARGPVLSYLPRI
jgi:hypothetical protein